MTENIMVSVICLAYNHERYIRKCLDGFVMQKTNFAFEVLVHDDASNDHTAEIIREYESKYPDIIKPIYQTENQYSQKIPITKTFLIPRAKGKYIAFCEGDDFWIDENKLQMQYDAMEAHPECSACYCKVYCCTEDESMFVNYFPRKAIKSGVLTQHEMVRQMFLNNNRTYVFQTSGYFLKKEVVHKSFSNGYRIFFCGDDSLVHTSVEIGPCYYIDRVLSCYRRMSKGSWSERRSHENELDKIVELCKWNKGELLFDKSTNYIYHELIYPCVKHNLNYYYGRIASYDSKEKISEFINNSNISFKEFVKVFDNKNKIRVALIYFFPYVWQLHKK